MKKESIWGTIGIGIIVYLVFETMHYFKFNWKEWIVPGIVVFAIYKLIEHRKGIKSSLHKPQESPGEVKMPALNTDIDAALLSQAELIISAYGKTLEYLAPNPGSVSDDKKLPFPKAKIKAAIVLALRSTQDKNQQARLVDCYLHLASFQSGVGSRNIGLDLSTIDASKLSDADVMSLGATIIESTEEAKPWLEKSSLELTQLVRELGAAGFATASTPS
jgi:hypothetical protein